MLSRIQKWGNSQGVRIPKLILKTANISIDDEIDVEVIDGKIILKPVKKHQSLKQRLFNYHEDYQCTEFNIGNPRGREVL